MYEYKCEGTQAQYSAIEEAIRTTQFVRNKRRPSRCQSALPAQSGKETQTPASSSLSHPKTLSKPQKGPQETGKGLSQSAKAARRFRQEDGERVGVISRFPCL